MQAQRKHASEFGFSIAAVRFVEEDVFLGDYLGYGVEKISAPSILRQKFQESEGLGYAWLEIFLYAQRNAVSARSQKVRRSFIQVYGNGSLGGGDKGGVATTSVSSPLDLKDVVSFGHQEPTLDPFPVCRFQHPSLFCGPYSFLNLIREGGLAGWNVEVGMCGIMVFGV